MAKKITVISSMPAEEKIKEAARKIFTRKGYKATRTRDIAAEAGINLALLNYYFRSKEKLFQIVMLEKLEHFFGWIVPVFYDPATTLEAKLDAIAAGYTDMLLANADLPFFIIGEARSNPGTIAGVIKQKDFLKNSVFIKQVKAKNPGQDPYQFLLSLLGMCIFPFVVKPIFQQLTGTADQSFKKMMQERKKIIAQGARAILKVK